MRSRAGQLSRRDLAWFLVSPLTSLLVNPIATIRTLAACRALTPSRRTDFNAFASGPALLKTFYWAQALNFRKYGRHGTSPLLGFGQFPVGRLWHQSTAAVSLDASLGGVITCLIGMSGWIATHALWLGDAGIPDMRILATVALAAVTTNFFGNVFGRQNYNIYGWAVFPAIVHGVLTGNVWTVAIATTVASVFSITVVVMTIPLWVLVTVYRHAPFLVFGLAPAAAILLNRTRGPAAASPSPPGRNLKWLLTSIGAIRRSRYRRHRYVWQSFALAGVLAIVPVALLVRRVSAFGLSAYLLAALTLVPIVGFVLAETRVFRFADAQSYLFAFLTISTGTTLAAWDPYVAVAWWIANSNSAVGRVLFNFDGKTSWSWAPAVKPFDMRPIRDAIDDLFSVVPPGHRVWLACDDPGDEYNGIYDGYSDLFQLAHFCANYRGLLLTPDWYAVIDHNVDVTAPSIWGRDADAANGHAQRVGADFILVYERRTEDLEPAYRRAGWTERKQIDWAMHRGSLAGNPMFANGWVTWRLFERQA